MDNLKTNDELIEELLTPDEQTELHNDVESVVKRIRGGARPGAGRKKKDEDNVLKFQIRVSQREKNFLNYARSHNLNYDDLMQG